MPRLLETDLEFEILEKLPELPGLPEKFRGRDKADCVKVPVGYMGITGEHYIEHLINLRWGKVIANGGDPRLWVRQPTFGRYWVTSDPYEMENYPLTHYSRPGQPRFIFVSDPNDPGVMYGFEDKL